MSKTVRRLLVGDIWRIGEHEHWFSDMAKDGLHLEKMSFLFAHFRKGEPKDIRYRIDTSSNKKMSEEEKAYYRESGWEHVSRFGEFNVFSSPAALQAPELHTDPAEQSYTLASLDKKLRTNTYIVALLTLFILAMNMMLWFVYDAPTLAFIEGDMVFFASSSLLYLFGVYIMVRTTLSIRKLRVTLLEGSPINHQAPWKKHYRVNQIVTVTVVGIAAASAALPWVQMGMHKEETLPLEEVDAPIVRLADIEQNPDLVRNEIMNDDGVDIGNRVIHNWRLLAPIQYETNENGVIPEEVWEDGSGSYSPSVSTLVYQLRFPSMKEGLITDLIAKNELFFTGANVKRLESDFFDVLITRENDGFKEVFAGKGKGVMYVSYFGEREVATVLDIVAKKIGLIAE